MTALALLGSDPPAAGPADWNDEGVLILPGFFRPDQLRAYRREWAGAHGYRGFGLDEDLPIIHADQPRGWADACPYMRHPALMALCCDGDLATVLEMLTGDVMGVNLNLTGWVSTERDWHADSYLNEPEVGDWYAAVWIALGDIHPESGVFQYVPGSHRWPQITRETIARYYDLADPMWPKQSEELLTGLFETEIDLRDAEVVSYVPRKGDVLVWHGRTLHRGSKARIPGALRPALIAHYSGIHHRPQMPTAVQHRAGGWYFPIPTSGPVR
jgi:hypothetical protein